MFLVSDGSRDKRKAIIMRSAATDKAVGMLLSEIDFEWTLRRAILKLSKAPTKEIRIALKDAYGLDSYKCQWKTFVSGEKGNPISAHLCDVVNGSSSTKGRKRIWQELTEAVDARNRLVHGVSGFIKDKDAEHHTKVLLAATDAITDYCRQNGVNIFGRITPRRAAVLKKAH